MENNPLSRNRGHAIRSLMLSQSAALFGSGLVFPFYLIFIKEIGAGFTEYGLAYGLFTISSSLLQPRLGACPTDTAGNRCCSGALGEWQCCSCFSPW